MKNYTFASLSTTANTYGETNDCVVKAVSLITEQPYERAHNHCRIHGRENYKGCEIILMFNTAGVKLNRIFLKTKYNTCPYGATVMNLRGLNRNKKYIVNTSQHVLAVIGGKVEDWTADRQHRVLYIYECDSSVLNDSYLNTEEKVVISKGKRKARTSNVNWEMRLLTKDGGSIVDYKVITKYARRPSKMIKNIRWTFITGKPETKGLLAMYDVKNKMYV